jgi:protein-tyrosine phosphatase
MKDYLKKQGDNNFFIASSASSREELGNGVHYGTRTVLNRLGISCQGKRAVQLTRDDYDKYDYFIGMDEYNKRNMLRIFGDDKNGKVSLLLDYTNRPRDVADPWYTGNLEQTYQDIKLGVDCLYKFLKK